MRRKDAGNQDLDNENDTREEGAEMKLFMDEIIQLKERIQEAEDESVKNKNLLLKRINATEEKVLETAANGLTQSQ